MNPEKSLQPFIFYGVLSIVLSLASIITACRLLQIDNLILPACLLPFSFLPIIYNLILRIYGVLRLRSLLKAKWIIQAIFLSALFITSLWPTSPALAYRINFLVFMDWFNHAAPIFWLITVIMEYIFINIISYPSFRCLQSAVKYGDFIIISAGHGIAIGIITKIFYDSNAQFFYTPMWINTIAIFLSTCVILYLPSCRLSSRLKLKIHS